MPQINNNEYRDYFMQISDPGVEFFTADWDITERVQHLIQEDLVCAFEEELNTTALSLKCITDRWGICLSSFLFSMYINDLQEYLVSESSGVTIGHIKMSLLLYADGVVVFAKSSSELRQEMNKLSIIAKNGSWS